MSDLLDLARDLYMKARDGSFWVSNVLIDLKRLAVALDGDVTISKSAVDGTPPGLPVSADNTTSLRLENPTLRLVDGTLRGSATLVLPSAAPDRVSDPFKMDVQLSAVEVKLSQTPLVVRSGGRFGPFGYGVTAGGRVLPQVGVRGKLKFLSIFHTDWSLTLRYDHRRVATAVEAVLAKPSGTSAGKVVDELRHPGFDLTAVVRAALPLVGKVPVAKVTLSAPTTRPFALPLLGASFPFPHVYSVSGVVPTPPGTLFDIWAVGLGHTRSRYDAARGSSFTAAVLPAISVEGKSMLERFPVYGYLAYSHVRRVSDGLDLGFRFTLSPSTLDLAKLRAGSTNDQGTLELFVESVRRLEDQTRTKTLFNFDVFGRHDWLGGGN